MTTIRKHTKFQTCEKHRWLDTVTDPGRDPGRKGADMTTRFDRWMRSVDQVVESSVGLSVHELEDAPFMDWFEDGVDTITAARRALRRSGWRG